MNDHRSGFCYQELSAVDAIHDHFTGKERTTALAVYQAFTFAANEQRRRGGRDGFRSSRTALGRLAGTTSRTVDRYAAEFEKLGLLQISRERDGDLNLPNTWVLLSLGGGEAKSTTPRSQTHQGGEANDTPVEEVTEEEKQKASSSQPPTSPEVQSVWDHYEAVFGIPKHGKGLTGSRERVIAAALKEFSPEELCKALDGAKRWRAKKPGNTEIAAFLKTHPKSGTLTEHIGFFIDQADEAPAVEDDLDPARVRREQGLA